MIKILVPPTEQWDESKQEFVQSKGGTLVLEHSLISISKWEAKWKKPFLSRENKTVEEIKDYIKCMTINQVPEDIYSFLTQDNVDAIQLYIQDSMTATWFRDDNHRAGSSREQITSELVYYWMIAYNIPFDCEKWHLNRLLTLIRVCNVKSQPEKKRSRKDILSSNAALNAARKKRYGTRG